MVIEVRAPNHAPRAWRVICDKNSPFAQHTLNSHKIASFYFCAVHSGLDGPRWRHLPPAAMLSGAPSDTVPSLQGDGSGRRADVELNQRNTKPARAGHRTSNGKGRID